MKNQKRNKNKKESIALSSISMVESDYDEKQQNKKATHKSSERKITDILKKPIMQIQDTNNNQLNETIQSLKNNQKDMQNSKFKKISQNAEDKKIGFEKHQKKSKHYNYSKIQVYGHVIINRKQSLPKNFSYKDVLNVTVTDDIKIKKKTKKNNKLQQPQINMLSSSPMKINLHRKQSMRQNFKKPPNQIQNYKLSSPDIRNNTHQSNMNTSKNLSNNNKNQPNSSRNTSKSNHNSPKQQIKANKLSPPHNNNINNLKNSANRPQKKQKHSQDKKSFHKNTQDNKKIVQDDFFLQDTVKYRRKSCYCSRCGHFYGKNSIQFKGQQYATRVNHQYCKDLELRKIEREAENKRIQQQQLMQASLSPKKKLKQNKFIKNLLMSVSKKADQKSNNGDNDSLLGSVIGDRERYSVQYTLENRQTENDNSKISDNTLKTNPDDQESKSQKLPLTNIIISSISHNDQQQGPSSSNNKKKQTVNHFKQSRGSLPNYWESQYQNKLIEKSEAEESSPQKKIDKQVKKEFQIKKYQSSFLNPNQNIDHNNNNQDKDSYNDNNGFMETCEQNEIFEQQQKSQQDKLNYQNLRYKYLNNNKKTIMQQVLSPKISQKNVNKETKQKNNNNEEQNLYSFKPPNSVQSQQNLRSPRENQQQFYFPSTADISKKRNKNEQFDNQQKLQLKKHSSQTDNLDNNNNYQSKSNFLSPLNQQKQNQTKQRNKNNSTTNANSLINNPKSGYQTTSSAFFQNKSQYQLNQTPKTQKNSSSNNFNNNALNSTQQSNNQKQNKKNVQRTNSLTHLLQDIKLNKNNQTCQLKDLNSKILKKQKINQTSKNNNSLSKEQKYPTFKSKQNSRMQSPILNHEQLMKLKKKQKKMPPPTWSAHDFHNTYYNIGQSTTNFISPSLSQTNLQSSQKQNQNNIKKSSDFNHEKQNLKDSQQQDNISCSSFNNINNLYNNNNNNPKNIEEHQNSLKNKNSKEYVEQLTPNQIISNSKTQKEFKNIKIHKNKNGSLHNIQSQKNNQRPSQQFQNVYNY